MVSEGLVILFIVLAIGVLGGNELVALAAGIMIVLRITGFVLILDLLESYGVQTGVLFLFIGVLLPFARDRLGISNTTSTLFSPAGIIAVVLGALAAWSAAQGITLLTNRPEVMIGLIVGSIVGVSFFGGIPAGPLVTAGVAALLYQFLRA